MKSLSSSFTDAQEGVWVAHIQECFKALSIPVGEDMNHLIASVSTYCKEFHPCGLQTQEFYLLIARALCAVGKVDAARKILGSMQPHARHVQRWIEILSELHHFPQLLPYFSRGIVRPADWAGAQLDRMWTIDFSRLALVESDQHEMLLCKTVRIMLEKIAVFWDATSGEGTVGLKGLNYIESTAEYLLRYSEAILVQQKRERNWIELPKILHLDG